MDRGVLVTHGQGLHLSPAEAIPCKSRSSLSIQVTFRGRSRAGRFRKHRWCPEDEGLQWWELGCSAGGTGKSLGRAGSLQQGSLLTSRAFNL